jgi:hypothetical protein
MSCSSDFRNERCKEMNELEDSTDPESKRMEEGKNEKK